MDVDSPVPPEHNIRNTKKQYAARKVRASHGVSHACNVHFILFVLITGKPPSEPHRESFPTWVMCILKCW